MRYWFLKSALCFLYLLFLSTLVTAQLGKITIDLEKDKPTKFKTKTLKSERTGEKKFNLPRRIVQNTTSHYNYYFNANNKINEVIERARLNNNEIYYKLLPFYSYSLKGTAAQSALLDSVIYKATAGVLLHDLRSAWVDNFYLLIGKAYLLKEDFDSASMTFQFINYNLYPRKKKDDEQLIVGSNVNSSSGLSIANKENSNLIDKAFSRPPSRNDALVWQIRTLIEMEEYSDAAGLINTLRNDVNFPERLQPALNEVNAYWFYKQGMFDSAATHLENALANASDVQEKARSEYLLAQLYQLNRNYVKASEYYNKAIRHTTDPLLDIYANLNNAKMHDSSRLNEIDKNISHLVRMAKRDKFEIYRNIIYYSAAELALEKPDTAAAILFLKKSLTYEATDVTFKNKSFLKLADISFIQKDYRSAFAYYDSLQTGDSTLVDIEKIQEKRDILSRIVAQINIIDREDSLQHLAGMTPADRETFIKKLAKKLRKEQGIKDDEVPYVPPSSVFESKNVSSDIFASNSSQGDWYFYNTSVKSKGYTAFRSKWGKRQNIDNWRTISDNESSVNKTNNTNPVNNTNPTNTPNDKITPGIDSSGDIDAVVTNETDQNITDADNSTAISYEGLLEAVPTTPEKLAVSHTLLSNAVFELGKLFQGELEDYGKAIETYEESLQRYPDSLYDGELYMNLAYCYEKLGDKGKANYYKNLVLKKYPESKFAGFIKNPKAALAAAKNPEATKKYEEIYNLFIEGQFERALQEKEAADSLYADSYWTPQLLYIESVYYIKQKEDSLAIDILNNIVETYPNSLLKDKAERMIDVLKRRSEIEDYLTNLSIERAKEDEPIVIAETPVKQIRNENTIIKKDSVQKISAVIPEPVKKDIAPVKQDTISSPVNKDIPAKQDSVPAAVVKKENIPVKKDSVPAVVVKKENVPVKKDNTPAPVKRDSTPPLPKASFNFSPAAPQYVVMLLDKVDPVYISEARNAFVRYNREKFSGQNIEIVKEVVDKDKSLLIFRTFSDASSAITYSDNIKKDAVSEISWLPANKYSFFIISDANLQLLKENKNLPAYLKVLREAMPGKF